jgi:hypothetical protein
VHGLQGHPRDTWAWRADDTKPITSKPVIEEQRKEHFRWVPTKRKMAEASPTECKRRGHIGVHVSRDMEFHSPGEGNADCSSSSLAASAIDAPFWPYHFLPKDCPTSRILTWGYNSVVSSFFKGSANKNSIHSHARDLLEDLLWEREKCVRSPIRF